MNKKITMVLVILLLSILLFSGCTQETKSITEKLNPHGNLPPTGVISAPEDAYFGETIELSASNSYDSDGNIVSYNWDFGDGETVEGEVVKHIYKFENDFTIDYPLIYSVNLFVKDDDGSLSAIRHLIKIYPSKYIFYLNSQKLTVEKPSSSMDKIRGSGFFKLLSPQEFVYDLESPIPIQECTWNTTIYLEKSLFARANKVSVIFYDDEGNEIANKDENLGFSRLWKEKTVQVRGSFDKKVEFKSVKIAVYGFSIGKVINIKYGGEKASHIFFDFTS